MEITFTRPDFLWVLLAIPFLIIGHLIAFRFTRKRAIKFANFEAIARVSDGIHTPKNYGLLLLRIIIVLTIILSASGSTIWYTGKASNYNFVLAIDTSTSMLANDLLPTRLEAAKQSAIGFVNLVSSRSSIGIVSFAGTPFVEERPNTETGKIVSTLSTLNINKIGGTNIGDTIITSTDLLIDGDKAKSIILLTDGQSNIGTPIEDAIDYAVKNRVIVHTIGAGTKEGGLFANLNITSTIDEESLMNIASSTGGKYFRAAQNDELIKAYKEIVDIDIRKSSLNLSLPLLLFGLVLLLVEWLLINTRYSTIP